MLDVVTFCAHDLVYDVSPHLVFVLKRLTQAEAFTTCIQVPILDLTTALSSFNWWTVLVHPQLCARGVKHVHEIRLWPLIFLCPLFVQDNLISTLLSTIGKERSYLHHTKKKKLNCGHPKSIWTTRPTHVFLLYTTLCAQLLGKWYLSA